MKVAICADLHLFNFKMFAYTLPNGRNSRLQHALDVVDQMGSICKERDIKHIWFLGDFFNARSTIDIGVYIDGFNCIRNLVRKGLEVTMLVGNHDQYLRSGRIHSLVPFSNIAVVVDTPVAFDLGLRVACLPYTEDRESILNALRRLEGCDILLGHLAVDGSLSGIHGHRLRGAISLRDLNKFHFKRVFLGHFHYRQDLAKNVHYVGSMLQHSFGEMGQKKGFYIYDLEGDDLEFAPLRAPEFVEVESLDPKVVGNYVRLKSEDKRLAETLQKMGAKGVLTSSQPEVQITNLTPSLSPLEMVKRYVTEAQTTLNKSKLIEIGTRILQSSEAE